MKHVLSCEQYTRESLEDLYNIADDIVNSPDKYKNILEDKIIATMFFEPSTRTRLSFETAILKLGAKLISTENAASNSSSRKGETIEDTINVVQQYADAIVMRHSDDHAAEKAARIAKVPILNAGSGKGEHPTQALLDVYTIRKHKEKMDGLKVAILGDLTYGRTIHSLIKLLSLYNNIEIYGLSKKEFPLPDKYVKMLAEKNVKYTVCSSFDDIPTDVDVMYHTRIQSERFEGDFGKEEFIINKEILNKFSKDTLVLHPLPRLEEISTDIDDDPRALYFEQAANGVPIRMSLFLKAFELK